MVDLDGQKVVSPWFQETYEGVPGYFGCTNDPTYRAHLDRRIEPSAAPKK